MAKKKNKSKLKYLRPEQVEELRKMTTDELLLKSHKQQKAVEGQIKAKKEHAGLESLKAQIKDHKERSDDMEKVKKLRSEANELAKEVLAEIEETVENKKALEGGFRDDINREKEMLKIITKLISERPTN